MTERKDVQTTTPRTDAFIESLSNQGVPTQDHVAACASQLGHELAATLDALDRCDNARIKAEAELATSRSAVLEEAAQLAESRIQGWTPTKEANNEARKIAEAIRALKNADPQAETVPESQVSQTASSRAAPVEPAESASAYVTVPLKHTVKMMEAFYREWEKSQWQENDWTPVFTRAYSAMLAAAPTPKEDNR